jgi:translation initiation factor 4A
VDQPPQQQSTDLEKTDKVEKVESPEDQTLLETNWYDVVESFDDLGLKKDLLRGIYGYGYVKPSAIQQKGIKPILMGKDVIA